jgi:hypothetical protein
MSAVSVGAIPALGGQPRRRLSMNQEQARTGPDNAKTLLALLYFVCRALAAMAEGFLHKTRTFGERYLSFQAASAIAIMFFFTAFWRTEDVRPVFGFMIAYVVALVAAKLSASARARGGGPQLHSMYTGTPRIMRWCLGLSEETVKCMVEPMLVLAIGAVVLTMNLPLGTLLMLSGFGLFVSVNQTAALDHIRALDLNDALIDQSILAVRCREMRGQ